MNAPATKTVLIDIHQRVCTITFNRPEKKNAFNRDGWLALRDAIVEAQNNDAASVVVITGAGNNFSSGVDLSDLTGEPNEKPPFEVMMDELLLLDKPLLAAATGAAIGFGATALFHCDIVYVGESLKMRLPFVNLGLVPEAGCSYTLPRNIGYQQAAELLFTAEWINAEKAVETGIARRAFPDAGLLPKTLEKAAEIAQWPRNALRETKRTLMTTHAAAIAQAREHEMAGMMRQVGSAENIEAVTAFFEKRAPRFD
ncbi:MAG TPA: enoyl-CoA hydratase-related protein [Pseudomonadales bacterium]|nr:enoyl-CoA hydratase-related protein [Pseudomonadales bacterium]